MSMINSLLVDPYAKPAPVDHPIHDLLRLRWSPRSFNDEAVSPDELRCLLEAARWSPSASNEQPWSFLVATREDASGFATLLDLLNPGNQVWARQAAVLMIGVARRELQGKAQPNRTALYDLGQAVAHLTFQATALGLAVHQMAGFDLERARTSCGIPSGQDPVVAIALGRPAPTSALPDAVRAKDETPRRRKAQADFAFTAHWGAPWP
jgi:nitroreductase